MVTVKDICSALEAFAPPSYQESYDNAGFITGHPGMAVSGVLCCLDSTEAVLDEAIALGCNMVVAHHPIVFSGLKKITGKIISSGYSSKPSRTISPYMLPIPTWIMCARE